MATQAGTDVGWGSCRSANVNRRPAPPDPRPQVDLNQVVAYNVRAARELRGWTQEELAERLEPYLGQRLTQAGVSSIERAWDSDRRREFDAHELLIFAMVFDLPIIWFLLPPKATTGSCGAPPARSTSSTSGSSAAPRNSNRSTNGSANTGSTTPRANELVVEKLTGQPAASRKWSYKERRKEMLLALLDQHEDSFDNAVEELGKWVDHLRQAGLRGFIAEHTFDDDSTRPGSPRRGRDGIRRHGGRDGTRRQAEAAAGSQLTEGTKRGGPDGSRDCVLPTP